MEIKVINQPKLTGLFLEDDPLKDILKQVRKVFARKKKGVIIVVIPILQRTHQSIGLRYRFIKKSDYPIIIKFDELEFRVYRSYDNLDGFDSLKYIYNKHNSTSSTIFYRLLDNKNL